MVKTKSKKPSGINAWPADDRPREKLLKKGARSLSNSELLAILDVTGNNTSDQCKSVFEAAYLSSDKKTDKRSYDRLFPKDVLDQKRIQVRELNNILKAMGI